MKDVEIKQMLEYLAWSQRCNFKGDVINKAKKYMFDRPGQYKPENAIFYASQLQRILKEKGPVGAYQYFIEDDDTLGMLSYVLNHGEMKR